MGGSVSKVTQNTVTKVTNNVFSTTHLKNQNAVTYKVSAVQTAKFICGGSMDLNCPDGLKISNTAKQNVTIISSFSSQSVETLSQQMSANIASELQQSFAKEIGFLGGVGYNQDEMSTSIQNVVSASVNSVMTVENLNSILATGVIVQDAGIEVKGDCKISGNNCTISNESLQNFQLQQIVEAVASQIAESINNSEVAQKIEQDYTFKAKGVESLTGMVIFIVIGVIIVFGGVSMKGVKVVTEPKNLAILMGTLVVLFIVYLVIAKLRGWSPFASSST